MGGNFSWCRVDKAVIKGVDTRLVDWVYKGSRRISDKFLSGGSDSDASDKAKSVRFQELMSVTLGLVITLRFLATNADMHFGRLDATAML